MTLKEFVEKNCPPAVTLTAEQIQKAARECGYGVELVATEGKKSFFAGLFAKKQPKRGFGNHGHLSTRCLSGDTAFKVSFKVFSVTEDVDYDFGHGRLEVTWTFRLETGMKSVVLYGARIKNSQGYYIVLEKILRHLGIESKVLAETPEPLVKYPRDGRDGAPEEGTIVFLSRARELARENTEVEKIFQEPTGEILWEKMEDCWINACGRWFSEAFASKEEAEKAPEYGCGCGEFTSVEVRSFTLVYGEKVYL